MLGNGFVDWDDNVLLLENPAYRGLGWTHLRWMATTTLLGHWVPLTWLTLGLDYVVWGMAPMGYHLTSLLLHVANAVLVYGVATRLYARGSDIGAPAGRVGAAAAVLLFALHPLRVETVVWVTERRGVLSAFFCLVAVLAYLEAARRDGAARRWRLLVSVGAYVLALLSKATVMTLPAVLVLLDVYPLRRLPPDPGAWTEPAARRVWLEKLPYALASLAGGVASYWGQTRASGVTVLETPTWVGKAILSLWFFVDRTLRPVGLSPLYEPPLRIDPFEPRVLWSAAALIAISAAVVALRRRWPAGLAAWVAYGVLLAPVVGIVHAGPQLIADRYGYLACLPWALLAGAGAGAAARAAARGTLRPGLARLLAAAGLLAVLGLAGLTWRQVPVWRDSERLWRHAVAVGPRCSVCRINLGTWLYRHDAFEAARQQYEAALALRPDKVGVHEYAGMALARLGRFPEAISHFEVILDRYPASLDARLHHAAALMGLGRLGEAIEDLREIQRFHPPAAAAEYFERAAAAEPDGAIPRLGLFQAYVALGRPEQARTQHAALAALHPTLAALVAGALGSGP